MPISRPAVLALLMLLAACGLFGPATTPLRQLRLVAEPAANHDSATRLDLVLVYQAGALSLLPATAPQWFADRQALLDGSPQGIEVLSLELPPATVIERVTLPAGIKRALKIRAYAAYQSGRGQHFIDLSASHAAELRLRADDLVLQPLP